MKDLAQEFTQRFWVGNLDTRLPLLAAFLAILLLTHSLARLTWNVLPQPQMDSTAAAQQDQPRVQRVTREQPLAKKITEYNLFGKYEPQKAVVAPVQPAVVPETRLNLKLRGVFSSDDKTAARAIIADSRGEEDSYSIGAQVPGGAILNEIYPDRVILEHNGRLETLKLPVDDMPDSDAGPSSATASSRGAGVAPTSRISGSSVSQGDIAQASASTQDNAALLGQYRDALMNDPNSVMGLVNVRPYQKDGQLVGYRIRPGKDRALLRRFGLRSGDVVTAVNGVPMNNPVKALEVLRDLSSASQLTVDIERNGSPQSFTFQIQ
ncbi:type II secretion system protein GspC [Kaarinaea lacus]